MAIWKDHSSPKPTPAAAPESSRFDAPPPAETAPSPAAASVAPAVSPGRVATERELKAKESLIASDITIEGKIEGSGNVRIAGKFKGDVNVQGDLTIEVGAKLTGGVRADKVNIAGELEGNIEAASRVELLESGVLIGDLKAGSLTVAAGSRMRGQVEFGWKDDKAAKSVKSYGSGNGAETGTGS